MKKYHQVSNVRFELEHLMLEVDGQEKRFDIAAVSSVLGRALQEERNTFEVSPSGYGIHWPLLDEDISIDGLLGKIHKPWWAKKSA